MVIVGGWNGTMFTGSAARRPVARGSHFSKRYHELSGRVCKRPWTPMRFKPNSWFCRNIVKRFKNGENIKAKHYKTQKTMLTQTPHFASNLVIPFHLYPRSLGNNTFTFFPAIRPHWAERAPVTLTHLVSHRENENQKRNSAHSLFKLLSVTVPFTLRSWCELVLIMLPFSSCSFAFTSVLILGGSRGGRSSDRVTTGYYLPMTYFRYTSGLLPVHFQPLPAYFLPSSGRFWSVSDQHTTPVSHHSRGSFVR